MVSCQWEKRLIIVNGRNEGLEMEIHPVEMSNTNVNKQQPDSNHCN